MTWSLNEYEALARKAARGAGMSWGEAEEAGRAARRLEELGLHAARHLAALLEQNDGAAHDDLRPRSLDLPWVAAGGALCPITAGTCLNDQAAQLARAGAITLGKTACPVFLIPFAQSAARHLGRDVALRWQDTAIIAGPDTVAIAAKPPALFCASAARVTCAASQDPALVHKSDSAFRAEVSDDIAARLTRLAHRTYAPSTEASRIAGAGAGLTDND